MTNAKQWQTRNVGQCPTWWQPSRIYERRSINSRTAKFFVSKVKAKNCSMCCSCDIYCVFHIPLVIITTPVMTYVTVTQTINRRYRHAAGTANNNNFCWRKVLPMLKFITDLLQCLRMTVCLVHVYLNGVLVFATADSTWHLHLPRNSKISHQGRSCSES